MPSRRHLLAAAPALALRPRRPARPGRRDGPGGTASATAAGRRRRLPGDGHPRARRRRRSRRRPPGSRPSAGATPTSSPRSGSCRSAPPKITWGGNAKGSTDWFDAAVTALGAKDGDIARYDDTAGIPFDDDRRDQPRPHPRVNSGISKEEYDKLSKIAPTVAYPGGAVGHRVGGPARDDRHGPRPGGRRPPRLAPTPTRRSTTPSRPTPRSRASRPRGPGSAPPTCRRSASTRPPTCARRCCAASAWSTRPTVADLSEATRSSSVNLSAEKASTLDADLVVFYAEEGAGVEEITGDPLLGQIPALKKQPVRRERRQHRRPDDVVAVARCRCRSPSTSSCPRSSGAGREPGAVSDRAAASARQPARPGRDRRCPATRGAGRRAARLPLAAVVGGGLLAAGASPSLLSLLLGMQALAPGSRRSARSPAVPSTPRPRHRRRPALDRTVIGLVVGAARRAQRGRPPGADPQPARRARHPRPELRRGARRRRRHPLPRPRRRGRLRRGRPRRHRRRRPCSSRCSP